MNPPVPTALKKLRGNPGRRPLPKNEPEPEIVAPSCPKHLVGEARKEWRRMSKQLVELGLLSKIDRAALAGYCTVWGRHVEAEVELRKAGLIVKEPTSGYPIQNPYLAIANTALKQMRAFSVEFGLTPSSRSRVTVSKPEKKNPFQLYLAKAREAK